MKKKAKKSARVLEWVIVMVRGALGERLGTVSAPTREAAIEKAAKDFDVAPIDKKRASSAHGRPFRCRALCTRAAPGRLLSDQVGPGHFSELAAET